MKKFKVECIFTIRDYRTVEANSISEAKKKAKEFDTIECELGNFEDFVRFGTIQVVE